MTTLTPSQALDAVFGIIGAPAQKEAAKKMFYVDALGFLTVNYNEMDKQPEMVNVFDSFNNQRLIEETLDGTHMLSSWNDKKNRPMTDKEFDNSLNWRLSQFVVQDEKEVGIATSISNRFQGIENKFGAAEPCLTQFDRMIYEECNLVNYTVRTVQLRTGDPTPNTERPEEIKSWARCTFSEAVKLLECYRHIGTDFDTQRFLNRAAATRADKQQHPAFATVDNWNDIESIKARMTKFKPGTQGQARLSRPEIKRIAARLTDEEFSTHFPTERLSIIELAREMKKVTTFDHEAPIEVEASDWLDRYEQDSDEDWADSTSEVGQYTTDRYELDIDGVWVCSTSEVGQRTTKDAYGKESPTESYDEEGEMFFRDSEAFGYWFDTVIPIDKTQVGGNVHFYNRAIKALNKAVSQQQLNNLRKNIFKSKTGWNWHQTSGFWTEYKAKQRTFCKKERITIIN